MRCCIVLITLLCELVIKGIVGWNPYRYTTIYFKVSVQSKALEADEYLKAQHTSCKSISQKEKQRNHSLLFSILNSLHHKPSQPLASMGRYSSRNKFPFGYAIMETG